MVLFPAIPAKPCIDLFRPALFFVIPAKAGIQLFRPQLSFVVPAQAGIQFFRLIAESPTCGAVSGKRFDG